jgi:DNA-binding transcriptional LysR family regulator
MISHLPNLSAHQLQAVIAVARYSSFIAAAAELRLSQPGLSRIIRKVERELGTALFHRNTRRVALTTAGTEFVLVAERILHDLELGTEAIKALHDQTRGHVALACPMSIANNLLAGIIIDYKRRHPLVQLQIREGLQSGIAEDIRGGVVDFGIGFVAEPNDDLIVENLCNATFHVVFHKSHPFAGRQSVSLRELRDEPLVSMPPAAHLRRIFDGAAASEGLRLNHAITVNTYATVFELVRSRMGITILADPGIPAPDDPSLRSRPISRPRFKAKFAAMHLKSRPMSPAATGLKQLIHAYFEKRISE